MSVIINFNHIFMHIHMYVVFVTSYLCVCACAHVTLGELSYRTILECISHINYLDAAIMLIY